MLAEPHLQWGLLAVALTGHLQRTAGPAFDVTDLKAPRANVLVVHGASRIGKTTSCTLEAALAGAESGLRGANPPRPGLPVRIDLARSGRHLLRKPVLRIVPGRAKLTWPSATLLRLGAASVRDAGAHVTAPAPPAER